MEPFILFQGKLFHKKIQNEWHGTLEGAIVSPEYFIKLEDLFQDTKEIKSGRIDIFLDKIDDFVSLFEIKSTNWNKIKSENRNRLLASHSRQLLKYVDQFLFGEKMNVCAALIYPNLSDSIDLKLQIEEVLGRDSLQVFWYNS
jgi:hypothetical protein